LLGAAAIHFAVAPEHLRSYPLYGAFFLLVGLGQAGLAALILLRPSSPLLLGGASFSLVIVAIWLLSRTVGLPIAPIPWRAEPVGLPDILSTLMEWIAAWLLIAADARFESAGNFRLVRAAPGLTLSLVVSLAWTVAGLSAIGGSH
jgi:hypothetical protein